MLPWLDPALENQGPQCRAMTADQSRASLQERRVLKQQRELFQAIERIEEADQAIFQSGCEGFMPKRKVLELRHSPAGRIYGLRVVEGIGHRV